MKVIAWTIEITLENGEVLNTADMPDGVSQVIDEWLSELESEE